MRRPGPRHVSVALGELAGAATPPTVLARVQSAWAEAAGAAVAAEAEPVAESGGTLTVACRSAAWTQELALLGPEIVQRLNAVLEPSGLGPLRNLRVHTGGAAGNHPRPARRRIP
ncbi:MAG: DciA family protein [Thermoleophilaceae bacterium]